MRPLIIAISHGFHSDEFTCSASAPVGLDTTDPEACRDFICKERGIDGLSAAATCSPIPKLRRS